MSKEQKPDGGSVGLHPIVGRLLAESLALPSDQRGWFEHETDGCLPHNVCTDAAAEIERLRSALQRVRPWFSTDTMMGRAMIKVIDDAMTPNETVQREAMSDSKGEPSALLGEPASVEPDIIQLWDKYQTEVIRIAPDGRIFWKGREVETDEQFRAAMLGLKNALMPMPPNAPVQAAGRSPDRVEPDVGQENGI